MHTEGTMASKNGQAQSALAILMLAEIKSAVSAFDHGESNVFDAIDAIIVAVEAYRAAANEESKRCQRRRDAA